MSILHSFLNLKFEVRYRYGRYLRYGTYPIFLTPKWKLVPSNKV